MASGDKPYTFTKNNTVDVLVNDGNDEIIFIVHKDPICQHSKFFRQKLTPRWYEEGEIVNLTHLDIDAKYFDMYLQCVYNERMCHGKGIEDLIVVYHVADQLESLNIANISMDEIVRQYNEHRQFPPWDVVGAVFADNIPPHSKLRSLFIDMLLHHEGDPPDFEGPAPQAFLVELAKKFCGIMVDPANPSSLPNCMYHEHDDDNLRNQWCVG